MNREIAKKTKLALLQSTKQRRVQALEQKFRRFELRKHMDEVHTISNCWLSVSVVIGCVHVWRRLRDNRLVKAT
jgi:hypothetical protein